MIDTKPRMQGTREVQCFVWIQRHPFVVSLISLKFKIYYVFIYRRCNLFKIIKKYLHTKVTMKVGGQVTPFSLHNE